LVFAISVRISWFYQKLSPECCGTSWDLQICPHSASELENVLLDAAIPSNFPYCILILESPLREVQPYKCVKKFTKTRLLASYALFR